MKQPDMVFSKACEALDSPIASPASFIQTGLRGTVAECGIACLLFSDVWK
jgi:hypothetical protein